MYILLSKFRSQVFEGAIDLFKKAIKHHILLYFIISLLSIIIVLPLVIWGLGWTFTDLMNFQETIQGLVQRMQTGEMPQDLIAEFFSNINFGVLFLAGLVSILINCFSYIAFFAINESKVFEDQKSFVDVLKTVRFGDVLKLIGFYFISVFFMIASFMVFFVLVIALAQVFKILAILVGFLGFFVVCIFLCRFTLALPALVHGKLSISKAFGYSFTHLTWKRSGLLFLMGIAFTIAIGVVSLLVSLIAMPFAGSNNEVNYVYFIVQQITSFITGVLMLSFSFSALSALYYRYSPDNNQEEEDNIEKHLIDNLE